MKHETAAVRLRGAYAGTPVEPLRDLLQPNDIDGAYAVQLLNTQFWRSQGRRVVGRKIGLTAAAVQRQLGVDQPDFGVLYEDMCVADAGVLSASKVIQPRVEAEVALIMGRDLDRVDASTADVVSAVESVTAAIEIVDSRIADWRITAADTIADNGSAGFFVLGPERRPLQGLDLYTCGMVLEVNGEVASVGAGAACLGHPLKAAAWLARTLAARGDPLRAGQIVLTGALGPMVPVTAGMEVRARISGLGAASFRFAAA